MKHIIPILLWGFTSAYAQTELSGRNAPYRATPEKKTQLKHTKLKVSFNFEDQTLSGEEWLTATPYFYPNDSLILDAKSMLIHEVTMNQQPLHYSYQNNLLKIKLDKAYQRGEDFSVYIRYTAQPNKILTASGRPSGARGLFFINPKGEIPNVPTQIWTQGETEASSCWFPTIDKPNQKPTQEIYMSVPSHFVTLSNGVLQSSKPLPNNIREDHWVMDKPHAPYLFFMGAGDFAVVKDQPWRGKVPIDYYVEKEYANVAQKIFGNTAEMMEFYSNKFGYEFPWPKYGQMVVRNFVAGAMENTTAVSHAQNAQQTSDALADQNHWEATIAHELAHHWFGDLVTAESWANLTINESFANYSEYLWYEYKYGKDAADHHLMQNASAYRHRTTDFQKHLVRFGYGNRGEMFDAVSYKKGGTILHMLRNYLGDEAFFGGIAHFLKAHEYGTGEAHQLRLAFEKVSGKDLNWFFNQWYFSYGHPTLKVEQYYDKVSKKVQVKLIQTQADDLLFEFPLEVDVYQNGQYQRHQVWATAQKENTFYFPAETLPHLVNINPRGVILAHEITYKTPQAYAYQYQHAKDFKSRYEAVDYAVESQDFSILLMAIKDPSHHIRIKALTALVGQRLAKKDLAAVVDIAQNDEKTLVQAAALKVLAETKDRKYLPLFEKALDIHSAAVKNAATKGIATLSPSLKSHR